MDFRTITHTHRYGVRVTALIIRDNQLLTYRCDEQNHLVGGAIEVGESTHDAVCREVKEELGLNCRVNALMFVVENRFDYKGELHHMVEFHYRVELDGEPPCNTLDDGKYCCQWLPLDHLEHYDLRPRFLKTALLNWQNNIEHVVVDETQNM